MRCLVDLFIAGSRRAAATRSCWTWTPPTIRCTASRRAASSTATTAATATCRCTSSAASICCAPGCGRRTSTRRRAALEEVERIVEQIRQRWPEVRDRAARRLGFLPRAIMTLVRGEPAWITCSGWPRTSGCDEDPGRSDAAGRSGSAQQTAKPARVFKDFRYRTRKSWSRERRVVGKAEHLDKGSNPRFVVTSLSAGADGGADACTRICTAPAGRWRTASRSSNWRCSPTAPVDGDDAGQPAAAVLLLDGLRADAGAAAAGPGRARSWPQAQCHDDPAEAAEDRRAGAHHGAQGVGVVQ